MATLSATYTWAASEADFRARLGIASGQDAELRGLLSAAARGGDSYLRNPFDGSDDLSPSEHPPEIWEGIVAWAQAHLRLSSSNAGLTAATTGSLQEQYGAGLDPRGVKAEAVRPFWWNWKRGVWI